MGKPQDLPGGRAQMQIGIAFALVSYVLAVSIPLSVERAFLQALLDLTCTGIVIWFALFIVGHPARFEQAFGGLCGASMFINLAALPLFLMRSTAAADGLSMALLADLVLLVWGLSLMAHVIRHTFEVRLFVSVVLSVAFFILLSSLVAALWPQTLIETDRETGANSSQPGMSYGEWALLVTPASTDEVQV